MSPTKCIRIAIDRGGTFTDVWASLPGKPDVVLKLLSVDPSNYDDAPTEGIRRVLSLYAGREIPRGTPLPKHDIEFIRMGTTVATNALLERKGTRHAFLVTKGFRDLLKIGYQSRPRLFDLNIVKPEVLYDEIREVDARVTIESFEEDIDGLFRSNKEIPGVLVRGTSGDMVRILTPLNERQVRQTLRDLRNKGIDTLAVCFTHSHVFPDHEKRVYELGTEEGFTHISLSSAVAANMIKMVPRGSSASADAYLTPVIKDYLTGFAKGFDGGLHGIRCDFMQSDGGLVSHNSFSGLRGILSGPAGGVVGYANTCYDQSSRTPVVGFDMGGTSTDVSRYGGHLEHIFESSTAGVTIQSPQLDINTVAAGGGSILYWRNGLFTVGPESASSHPGPASYRKGGPLTVTDANLYLGRLIPEFFPKIFGRNEDQPLDTEIVHNKFAALTAQINADTGRSMTPEEVACGFLDVANEGMSRPIRALTEAKGYEIANHHLSVFGGAGGQHACDIARKLGISKVIIHRYSSILSAYGMALANIVQELQEPVNIVYEPATEDELKKRLTILKGRALHQLRSQGIYEDQITYETYLNMRYQGTETSIMVLQPPDGDFKAAFQQQHLREFAFLFPASKPILVDDIRVRGIGASRQEWQEGKRLDEELQSQFIPISKDQSEHTTKVYFQNLGKHATPIFLLSQLSPGNTINGPAIIIDETQTLVITPDANAKIMPSHVIIQVQEATALTMGDHTAIDHIQLSVFSHRFMGIAEQMGRALQKTSVSLNIKERLDFSCALFGPDGALVANAPHVPVHLGSMSYAVKYQHELHKGKLMPGDVLVTNHPEAGGTHLPDITVITPVFEEAGQDIAFYVASRGHHTDIGGLGGTSMPPSSTELWQEGAAIRSFKLIQAEKFDVEGITEILLSPGRYPGCTGSRHIADNISDLKAQVAANHKGMALVQALIKEYSLPVVHLYMKGIQENAELAVRDYLRAVRSRLGPCLTAEDQMDSGSLIKLAIEISPDGSAAFDFTGTDCELLGNINAPPAITHSSIIYTMRLLIGSDIPLNQGCLTPIKVTLPKGSFLNPSAGPAVCAGNTLTSQRIVDVLLKAFHAAAASQGCMNCLGFFGEGGKDQDGKKLGGYAYAFGETICGGSGATATQKGASGVHTHMTNTRITDPESLEKRYPVILREFAIRPGTGGNGVHKGGDGVVRDIECRAPLSFSVITERRSIAPYGMNGGEPGERGANYWVRRVPTGNGQEGWRWVNMGSKTMVRMETGDRCVIHTPGGGGWGRVDSVDKEVNELEMSRIQYPRASGSVAAYVLAQESSA
ncbi:Hydantoinase B/oxoprolinase-domain-containing protein [Aspergillus avenaceus]|uniref:Hydantoinase B/oxoprolinase-domain-containing protein n=1 Tax=Aspergillus avenaceus TaxID=36643 RepID=A0A5N6TL24_ASPAV|nr:Hydantoinase B/oxoprolinase-domain-containing protein [Aspergillus avenaceus]